MRVQYEVFVPKVSDEQPPPAQRVDFSLDSVAPAHELAQEGLVRIRGERCRLAAYGIR